MPSTKSAPRPTMTGDQIRQAFLDFFAELGHVVVPSSSLVPGADQTLLFTNAGMVQFKDVFLGQDRRPYRRATTAQRCMRVSGKHNDLENVGPSPRHHTFFEMLGNFSFGDYFKREAIRYAYECLTRVFELDPARMYYTVHESDDEALRIWLQDIGVSAERVARMGDKTNFWQMADTGPCGPTAEIHYDFAPERGPVSADDLPYQLDVNPDDRFLEIWNLVFMQYSQSADGQRTPLPAPGVDTGMGLERLAMIVQGVDNSYDTDLFVPIMARIQALAGHDDAERQAHLVAYRVIADHVRAATFLIADGVVPGNTGRNYVSRMVIRRASRFGRRAGFDGAFLAGVAETVIERYGAVYPEIVRNRNAILRTITEEEERFERTLDTGLAHLSRLLEDNRRRGSRMLSGERAFDLYATYGLPFELTRDIARENQAEVEEAGFQTAMEAHRLASSTGQFATDLAGKGSQVFQRLAHELMASGRLPAEGVAYDPYHLFEIEALVLALVRESEVPEAVSPGDSVAVVLPETCFYVEAGGQVSDTGTIVSLAEPRWEIRVEDVRRPAAGVIAHYGRVVAGKPRVGDAALAAVDAVRRWDIMRNHTATHLLHAALRAILGEHVRQAGSLVAPDRLRFDFTHPQAMTPEEIMQVEGMVNDAILDNYELEIAHKPRQQAIEEGAMALFGEIYGEVVRAVSIGREQRISYELCGGTHVPETGVIGLFLTLSEGSVASGVRRIEAVTGRGAYAAIQLRLSILQRAAARLEVGPEAIEQRLAQLLEEREQRMREVVRLKERAALDAFHELKTTEVGGVPLLVGIIPEADADLLRSLTDRFRQEHPTGVAVLASTYEDRPVIVAAVSQDLVPRGIHAGELAKAAAQYVGGSGGGRPTLAQAGGKDASRLLQALEQVPEWLRSHLT
ncbi:MAG: alanine--tRNA ligase [Chloroflexota bacterium]